MVASSMWTRAQTKAERQSILQRRYEQKRTQMAQQMEGKNVYVKNLAPAVDEDKLKAAFVVCILHHLASSCFAHTVVMCFG